ncbi:hypothetical protein ABIE67_003663 [Streptomyces sp. V4I8]
MCPALDVGELVYDTTRDRVGEVKDCRAGVVVLRPSGGGPAWEATPGELQPANANDRLRARVNEMNAMQL